ncbi:hypothetical protein BU23DRAFT_92864 [Bimuria novae-zelandiae CBS 107.79]|uniref:Uncharacterized protein n=1 Tax=Bimuria novae-zelandiae CBS 107.79 TaxID=1447943 RepID=A0A6A5VCR9_9PLEO|nr:hypothetical protein BU23DRAFT_92864 [Bimuria novae-zelandiae CBS 107.79]
MADSNMLGQRAQVKWSQALDDIFGALEVALDQSNRQIEQECALADEHAADPSYDPEDIECEFCNQAFPITTWFFDVHTPRCEQEKKRISDATGLGAELECAFCKERMHPGALFVHLNCKGPEGCREQWRILTVVEKKRCIHSTISHDMRPACSTSSNRPFPLPYRPPSQLKTQHPRPKRASRASLG